jgi:putative endonuclease
MASESGTLYIGMTNNLERRTFEHRHGLIEGFSNKYNCKTLVYYEYYTNVETTIAREKQLKSWNRKKKENLIRKINPSWLDLAKDI